MGFGQLGGGSSGGGAFTGGGATDTTPAAFNLGSDLASQGTNTFVTTNIISPTGIDGPCAVVCSGTALGKVFRINGGAWVTSGFVDVGDTVQGGYYTSVSDATSVSYTMTIGGNVTSATSDTINAVTAGAADVTAPSVVSLFPADNSTNISTITDLVITWSEDVILPAALGTSVYLRKVSDDSVVQTWFASDYTDTWDIVDDVSTFSLDGALTPGTEYRITVGSYSVTDAAGNGNAAITGTSWTFTTTSSVPDALTIALGAAWVATDTQPPWDISGTFEEGDIIKCYDDGVLQGTPYTIGSGEADDGDILGASFGTLAVGDHSITMTLTRGVAVSAVSNQVDFTTTSAYSTEVGAWLARTALAAPTDDLYIDAIETLIDYLVATSSTISGTLWSRADYIRVYANKDLTTGLLNLKSATYNASAVNSPTFTADFGVTGNSAGSKYVNSNYNANTVGGRQNSFSLTVVIPTSSTTGVDESAGGAQNAGNDYINILPKYTNGSAYFLVNDAAFTGVANTQIKGIYTANRSASNARAFYKNGNTTPIDSDSVASSSVANCNIFELAQSNLGTPANIANCALAAVIVGQHYSATDIAAIHAALNTCFNSINGSVIY